MGVTALVGKAVNFIYEHLVSLSSQINEDTNFHFYVFGFSRGSTCARLFTQLTARESSTHLPCEKEFSQSYNQARMLVDNGRLPFMERNFLTQNGSGTGIIDRAKVKVEFLGIYDTVASIGFLQQKDGWVNSLKDVLEDDDKLKKLKELSEQLQSYNFLYEHLDWIKTQYDFIKNLQMVPDECKDVYHFRNAYEYGLYIPQTKNMGYVIHICAADEFRENFALVNIGRSIENGKEIIIPGCHSDVGGSYIDGVNRERVLYNFIPRKNAEAIKTAAQGAASVTDNIDSSDASILQKAALQAVNKAAHAITDNQALSTISEIASKRIGGASYNEEAYMFVANPWTPRPQADDTNVISIFKALPQLGWVDEDWGDEKYCQFYDENSKLRRTTINHKVTDDEFKFTGYRLGEYSTIPLKMMLTAVKGDKNKGFKGLFRDDFTPYAIPGELETLSQQMVKEVSSNDKRVWLVPEGGYSGDFYRNLRRKYLHFTASSQLLAKGKYWKLKALWKREWQDLFALDAANFGNECNYDNNAMICRILYSGDDTSPSSCAEGVNYMYSCPGEQFKIKTINGGTAPNVILKTKVWKRIEEKLPKRVKQ
ncbi:MAG: DUF2235 domain-containing protein [Bacteroidales bacterium]|nr:DUF2235 domain-containing protein [Bacteroidales bacterium]